MSSTVLRDTLIRYYRQFDSAASHWRTLMGVVLQELHSFSRWVPLLGFALKGGKDEQRDKGRLGFRTVHVAVSAGIGQIGGAVNKPEGDKGIIYTWYDDFCFQCQRPVKRHEHTVTGHKLLSDGAKASTKKKIAKTIKTIFGEKK